MQLILLGYFFYRSKTVSARSFGIWLARRIEKMGGIYVKIGQLLSVRPDIISFSLAQELHPLLQQLTPIKFKDFENQLRQYLGNDFSNLILTIETQPLGTGSIAQVHKAVLTGGKTVVIKMLKPGIQENIDSDMRLFRFFMKAGSFLPGINKLPVNELVLEIDAIMREQLNLLKEADNLKKFKDNFALVKEVIIPDIFLPLCRRECIVMDYLPLCTVPDYENWEPSKRITVAAKALRMLYQMMFRDGFTHCDLHPGNFFVTEEGRFILLDFGMVTEMNDSTKNDFISFFYYMSTNNGKMCAGIIEKTALFKSSSYNRARLDAEISLLITEFSKLPAEKFSVLAFTKRLIQAEKKCGLKGATNFINNILAITFFEAHLKKIHPAVDFQKEAARYIMANTAGIA
jgi:ubiquinone biosynthesis protein